MMFAAADGQQQKKMLDTSRRRKYRAFEQSPMKANSLPAEAAPSILSYSRACQCWRALPDLTKERMPMAALCKVIRQEVSTMTTPNSLQMAQVGKPELQL